MALPATVTSITLAARGPAREAEERVSALKSLSSPCVQQGSSRRVQGRQLTEGAFIQAKGENSHEKSLRAVVCKSGS